MNEKARVHSMSPARSLDSSTVKDIEPRPKSQAGITNNMQKIKELIGPNQSN